MAQHSINISKTAVYHTHGNPDKASKIIFALHGYGQLAQYFIRKFAQSDESYFVVAPEGFHRFYLKGSSGRVGASWMTKEKREEDIADYISYLDQVWNEINSRYSFEERILLGFSQGGATAARWHEMGQYNAQTFILWAGVFPPDLTQRWQKTFSNTINIFVVGNEDEYFNEEKIEQQKQYFRESNVKFQLQTYNGNHSIHIETLNTILK